MAFLFGFLTSPHLWSVNNLASRPWDYFEVLASHVLGQLFSESFSLPQHLISQIHWPVVQRAEWLSNRRAEEHMWVYRDMWVYRAKTEKIMIKMFEMWKRKRRPYPISLEPRVARWPRFGQQVGSGNNIEAVSTISGVTMKGKGYTFLLFPLIVLTGL